MNRFSWFLLFKSVRHPCDPIPTSSKSDDQTFFKNKNVKIQILFKAVTQSEAIIFHAVTLTPIRNLFKVRNLDKPRAKIQTDFDLLAKRNWAVRKFTYLESKFLQKCTLLIDQSGFANTTNYTWCRISFLIYQTGRPASISTNIENRFLKT